MVLTLAVEAPSPGLVLALAVEAFRFGFGVACFPLAGASLAAATTEPLKRVCMACPPLLDILAGRCVEGVVGVVGVARWERGEPTRDSTESEREGGGC